MLVKTRAINMEKAKLYRNLKYHLPVPTDSTVYIFHFFAKTFATKSECNNFEGFMAEYFRQEHG